MARLTKEDWQALRDVPILSYLDANGIDYVKDGHNRYKLVEHDSLTINVQRNQFYWNSRDEKGDLGNFIEAYEGLTKGQAIAKWQEFGREYGALSADTKERYNAAVQPSIQFDWNRLKKSDVTDTAQNYLVNERKLDPQLVTELLDSNVISQGYPFKDRETGQVMSAPILFPWRNVATGKIEGADRQGTDINFEKFGKRGTEKRVQAGSSEHGGFSISAGTGADKLIAFESPIDLLSYAQMNYKQLNEDNATLFAVSGTNHKKVNTFMRDMFTSNGKVPDKIVIAADNDLAGEQMANRYVNDMSFNNIEISRIIPVVGKDWNDQLKQGVAGETKLTWDQSAAILEGRKASENGEVNLADYGVAGAQKSPKEVYKDQLREMLREDPSMAAGAPNEVIYQIDDLKIYGGFEDGIRGVDHNSLHFDGVDWEKTLEWGTIVVPETQTYVGNEENLELEGLGFTRLAPDNNHIINKSAMDESVTSLSKPTKEFSDAELTIDEESLGEIVDQLHRDYDLLNQIDDVELVGYDSVREDALTLFMDNETDFDVMEAISDELDMTDEVATAFYNAGYKVPNVKQPEPTVVPETQVMQQNASQVETASDPAWVTKAQQTVDKSQKETPVPETKDTKKQERKLSKQERAEQTRKANQAIIKQSVANVADYKNDPAKVSELINFIAENGNSYSPRNTLLINGQRPGSTVVKGYEQFKAAGFQVNKGEKGMKIIGAPTKTTTIFADGQRIPMSKATPEQRSLAKQGVLESKESVSYPIRTVFDISQTDAYAPENAHKLPELMPNKPVDFSTDLSSEQVGAAYDALTDYAKKINVSVIEDDTRLNSLGRPNGAFYPQQNTILVRSDLPDTQKAAVLAHEIGHASLHNTDSKVELTRPQKELQAELTSLVVMKNLGIDTQEQAERYISNWTDGMKNVDDPNGHLLAQVTTASMDVTNHVQQQLHEKLGSSIKTELNDTQVDSRIQNEQQATKLATTAKQEHTQSRGR